MLLVCHFTQKTWKRGDLFPILTTNDSSIFLSNSVNHGQGLMCLKFKPLFRYKQHPIVDKPTRGSAILDPVITDLHSFYQKPIIEAPLQPDTDNGEDSDHNMVLVKPLNNIDNKID